MCRTSRNWSGLIIVMMILLLVFLAATAHHYSEAPKIEIDTSHLEEYGMLRLRYSAALPIWEMDEKGWIEVTKLDSEKSTRVNTWSEEWCYITLTEGSGKYTLSLRWADQSSEDPPVTTSQLEVMDLEPLKNVHGFENVQLFVDGEQGGIWARRVYDKTETGMDEILSIQKNGDDTYRYTYALGQPGTWELFPLTEGNGDYTVKVNLGPDLLETGTSIRSGISTAKIDLPEPNIAFSTPSSVISYCEDSLCVTTAAQLTRGLETDQEKIDAIVDYVVNHLTYDRENLEETRGDRHYTIRKFDADEILTRGTGVCGDYAALTVAMLRSQGIPCKYVGGTYTPVEGESGNHAWVEVQTDEGQWTRLDPTHLYSIRILYADNEEAQKQIEQAIKDDERYSAKYYL